MKGNAIDFKSIIQQDEGCRLKIVLLNVTKLSLKFQLIEI